MKHEAKPQASDRQVFRGAPEGGTLDELLPAAYSEMKRTARGYARSTESTSPTGLVHEAYLKLAASRRTFESHQHLCAAAALTMRRIAIDSARSQARTKRGGDRTRVPLLEPMCVTPPKNTNRMTLASALEQLAQWDLRKARAVGLHYLEGYGIQETANVLKISRRTVLRDLESSRDRLASILGAPSAAKN